MLAAIVAGLMAAMTADESAAAIDPKVARIIQRSRATEATYSVYSWRSREQSGGDWSAEFHSGHLHRVESAFNRLVANCATMTGAALDLKTGQIDRRDWVAKAACGIQSIAKPLSSQWLGEAKTRFGLVDRIRITDDASARTYEVMLNGALVGSTYAPISGEPETVSTAIAVSSTLPSNVLFTEQSLGQSFVPEKYKSAPKSAERG